MVSLMHGLNFKSMGQNQLHTIFIILFLVQICLASSTTLLAHFDLALLVLLAESFTLRTRADRNSSGRLSGAMTSLAGFLRLVRLFAGTVANHACSSRGSAGRVSAWCPRNWGSASSMDNNRNSSPWRRRRWVTCRSRH